MFLITYWEKREVSPHWFISYPGNKYSVPYRYDSHQRIKVALEKQMETYDEVKFSA